jgi:hypothetical protein
MKGTARLGAVLLGFACALLAPARLWGQERPPDLDLGSHVFRQVLSMSRCTALHEVADLEEDPRHTLLVVFGDVQILDQLQGGLAQFRRSGGAVLIATDRADRGRLGPLGVQVVGLPLQQAGRRAYRGNEKCPLVTDADRLRHPLFTGLRLGVATNRPSYLHWVSRQTDLRTLANITDVKDPPMPWFEGAAWPVLAAGGDEENGRVVVMAGHGVFQNALLLASDNDNFAFALNCVRWLTEGDRRRVLFVEEGHIQTSFPSPLALPLPSTRVLDRMLRALEEENVFNRLLLDVADKSDYVRAIVLLVTLLVVFWGLRRLFLARHHLETRIPLLARKVAQTLAAPAAAVQRREALLRGGNLWEAARDLARECFQAHAVPGAGAPQPPTFTVPGGWRQRRRLGRLLRRLWGLAYGPAPTPVSGRRLTRVVADAAALDAALAEGRVRFGGTG